MKKRTKIFVCLILIISLLLPSTLALAAPVQTDQANKMMEEIVITTLSDSIAMIEQDLSEKGMTVSDGLQMFISKLESDMAIAESRADKEQLQQLIIATQEMQAEFDTYKKSQDSSKSPIYAAAITAIVAWFGTMQYWLSAECLTHAKNNKVLDSQYIPAFGNVVNSSPVWAKIQKTSALWGTDTFPNSGNYQNKDLYYAIHLFSWTKPTGNSTRVTLNDRYDFALNDKYSGLAGTAVNICYLAQLSGYLTPFKIKITSG